MKNSKFQKNCLLAMDQSKRYNLEDVLELWEDIPDDNNPVTDESSSDESVCNEVDSNYIPPDENDDENDDEIDVSEAEISNEKKKPKRKHKSQHSSSTKKQTGETVEEQLKKVEEFLAKNNPTYPLLASEIKKLQELLASKAKKISVAQVQKLVEIARRQWKKVEKAKESFQNVFQEGKQITTY